MHTRALSAEHLGTKCNTTIHLLFNTPPPHPAAALLPAEYVPALIKALREQDYLPLAAEVADAAPSWREQTQLPAAHIVSSFARLRDTLKSLQPDKKVRQCIDHLVQHPTTVVRLLCRCCCNSRPVPAQACRPCVAAPLKI